MFTKRKTFSVPANSAFAGDEKRFFSLYFSVVRFARKKEGVE
jgi:hypothetical protein